MYIPEAFREDSLEAQHQLIRQFPLGLLISVGENGPLATALPFHLVADEPPYGILKAHLARANGHWQSLNGQDVLIVFQGHDAYVTPSWYQSKTDHGMVVPTWNYTMVQVRGNVRTIDDQAWLRRQISALTEQQEAPRACPWSVTDAPAAYIESQMKAIVGLEIPIRQIDGKWKLSQNRSVLDRRSVAENLAREGKAEISTLVRQYGELD
jgi:transcriptional regulator